MTITRRQLALSGGALIAAAGVGQASAQEARRGYPLENANAPDFSAPRFGGGRSRLGDYSGRVLMLTFGGLWCPECIHDGANTNQLAAMAEADPDIDFLYLQCGPQLGLYGRDLRATRSSVRDAERAWRVYFARSGYNYPLAFDITTPMVVSRNFAIQWYPSNLIIDRAGVIRAWRTTLGPRGVNTFFAQARALAQA